MNIEGLSSEEIKNKITKYCTEVTEMCDNEKRNSQDVYDVLLESNDWILALGRIYEETNDRNIYDVLLILEEIKKSTENIVKEQTKGTKEKEKERVAEARKFASALLEKISS
ncbi:MAG TPA: hypothetical protein VI894_01400 [Candidatus Nanoarchaeia archaeon]|nr:hypothetical protein [Candidatus Nanoarchaeia archaeon]